MSSSGEVQPFTPNDGPDTGQTLDDRYTLLEVRGRGGFATVYHAYDRKMNTAAAIKLLDAVPDAKMRRRFDLEVEASARMVHPHLIRVSDRGEHCGRPYLVMPLLHGTPLRDRRGANYRKVCRWMRQFLDGMRALHEARAFALDEHKTRLLHRDIKPSNCFISSHGDLTIIDFGLVKPLDGPTSVTTQGVLVGSPAYMAPECLFGEAASERSDVYSIGVTFYEMLTGEPPYSGTVAELHAIHVKLQPPPSPRVLRPELPIALAELVQQAMAPLPADRPPTVDAMLGRLERVLRSLGDPMLESPQPRVRRPELALVPPTPQDAAPLAPIPAAPARTSRAAWYLAPWLAVAAVATGLAWLDDRPTVDPPPTTRTADDVAPTAPTPANPTTTPDTPDDAADPATPTSSNPPPVHGLREETSAATDLAPRDEPDLTTRTLLAAVNRRRDALRDCPGARKGALKLELVAADGGITPRRIDFRRFDRRDAEHRCIRRALADIRVPPSSGTFTVQISR